MTYYLRLVNGTLTRSRRVRQILLLAGWALLFPNHLPAQSPYPRQFIPVDGKKISYTSFGLQTRRPGDPVLVFEAGFGAGSVQNFDCLYPALSKKYAIVSYDRNGEGQSAEDSTLVTDKDLCRRLHSFLAVIHVPPPYILIGHSLGGPYIRLFTSLYPKEVAGLVFIDPPDYVRTAKQQEELDRINPGSLELTRSHMEKTDLDTLLPPMQLHRNQRLLNTVFRNGYFAEYASLPPLPDIPVAILLTHNHRLQAIADSSRNGHTIAEEDAIRRFRIENYTSLIENNHNSFMMILPGYKHGVHTQDPQLVVEVIERVYRNAIKKPGEAN
ncbi:MAG TPA: alpha/beta hydrolase [Puia sp.]|nr:alpha/beta hydrolase [Puia sp.]